MSVIHLAPLSVVGSLGARISSIPYWMPRYKYQYTVHRETITLNAKKSKRHRIPSLAGGRRSRAAPSLINSNGVSVFLSVAVLFQLN